MSKGIEQFRTEFLALASRGSALHVLQCLRLFNVLIAEWSVCVLRADAVFVGGYLCSGFLRSLLCSFAREARRLLLSSLGSLLSSLGSPQASALQPRKPGFCSPA